MADCNYVDWHKEKKTTTCLSIPLSQRYIKPKNKVKNSPLEKKITAENKYRGLIVELLRCTEESFSTTDSLWKRVSKLQNKTFWFKEGELKVYLDKIIICKNEGNIMTFKNKDSDLKLELLDNKIVLQYKGRNSFLVQNISIKKVKEGKEGLVIKLL